LKRILAIETSCDETAAAIVEEGPFVRSNVVASQIPVHARFGGVVPELASRNHLLALPSVIARALEEAGTTLAEIDAVAVTIGPGLAGCLLVGLQTAKGLAIARGLPLIPVDHVAAHVHAVYLADELAPSPARVPVPHVALAVSGGHTSLSLVEEPGRSRTLGQTLDDAAGEAFDKVAKMMGLPYPGGMHLDRLSEHGRTDAWVLPRPLEGRGLNFSFSGLKTAARHLLDADPSLRTERAGDLAASVQEAIVAVLVSKSLAACAQERAPCLVVAGGVASNRRLRQVLAQETACAQVALHLTPTRYCTDNAAMVGGLAWDLWSRGEALEGEEAARAGVRVTRRSVP
jgi:N6-L-threonylcarbamoyladenine synthase